MESSEVIQRGAGRPRDDATTPALLAAARRLVIERGYNEVSIGLIATEVGVGRQTLYRRWPSKAELVLDAFLESAGQHESFEDGRVEEVLATFLRNLFVNMESDGPAIRNLIASAQIDPAFLKSLKERFIEPRAEVAAAIFRRGIEKGELRGDADIDMALAALHGAFWYRLLQGDSLDAEYADRLAEFMLKAVGSNVV
jgi:AcrR family transcriptional regulator